MLQINPQRVNQGGINTTGVAKLTMKDVDAIREHAPQLLDDVRRIYGNARLCKELGRDEAAWSYDVVYPLGQLVLKLYGRDKWWFHPV